jgi:hypothetical protein
MKFSRIAVPIIVLAAPVVVLGDDCSMGSVESKLFPYAYSPIHLSPLPELKVFGEDLSEPLASLLFSPFVGVF